MLAFQRRIGRAPDENRPTATARIFLADGSEYSERPTLNFVGAALPLLDPQRSLYQLDLADAQKRTALLQYQKTVQSAFREVAEPQAERVVFVQVRRYADFRGYRR